MKLNIKHHPPATHQSPPRKNFSGSLLILLIGLFCFFANLFPARAGLILETNAIGGSDWSLTGGLQWGILARLHYDARWINPDRDYWTNYPVALPEVSSAADFYWIEATTGWLNPNYLERSVGGSEDWFWDGQSGSGDCPYVSGQSYYYSINQKTREDGTVGLFHSTYLPTDVWSVEVGFLTQYEGEPVYPTNSLTTNIVVRPMTIAFTRTNDPYINLEALPGSTSTTNYHYYIDPIPTVFRYFYGWATQTDSHSYAPTTTNTWTNTFEIDNDPNQFGHSIRTVKWYGSYSNFLNGVYTASRESLVSYLNDNSYNTNSGIQIGELITYDILEAHPPFTEASGGLADYAFQVHMKLGNILRRVPIYVTDTYAPTIPGPIPPNPIPVPVPVTPSSPVAITNFGIIDAALTGDIQAILTAENGVLTMTATNSLTSISGNGTSHVTILGPLANVNAALASLHYHANLNFSGMDFIRLMVDDLGHNPSGVPYQTTSIIPVLVNAGLSGGQFVSGTNFQFTIAGENSTRWQVSASTNLTDWVDIGTTSITNGTNTFIDIGAGAYDHRFYRATNDLSYSDSIGFIKVTVPGRTNNAGGFALIANQLNNESGSNTLEVLMPNVPDGTIVYKYNPATQSYNLFTFYGPPDNIWDPANATLNPGEGAFIANPTTNSLTLTFIGKVPLGQQSVNISTNFAIISSVVPQSIGWDAAGFPALDGDIIYRYNPLTQSYSSPSTFFGPPDNIWDPITPPNAGEAVYVNSASSTNRVWTRTFSVAP